MNRAPELGAFEAGALHDTRLVFMEDTSTGQLNIEAARVYDEFFLPALFEQWPPHVIARSGIGPTDHVLDVGCGTGVLARAASDIVGSDGVVVGVDISDGMLALAAQRAPQIDWRKAPAESLPFAAATFDRVVSQFGLMFFEDRIAAVKEMLRVLRPGGRVVVAVWSPLNETPGYAAMVHLLDRLFGADVACELEAPFCLGDSDQLEDIFMQAGAVAPIVETVSGTCHFPSLDRWIATDVKGWTLGNRIDDEQFQRLQQEAKSALAAYVQSDGKVEFEAPARLIHASVPA